jgi:hypothetical protein
MADVLGLPCRRNNIGETGPRDAASIRGAFSDSQLVDGCQRIRRRKVRDVPRWGGHSAGEPGIGDLVAYRSNDRPGVGRRVRSRAHKVRLRVYRRVHELREWVRKGESQAQDGARAESRNEWHLSPWLSPRP